MNSNNVTFSNNGAGLSWGNNNSRIYDNGNLYIVTDDYLNITAPTQLIVTSPSSYFSGNMYTNNNLVASQSWVQSQNYLTTSPATITVTGTANLNAMSINNGTGNSFIITQSANGTNDNLIQFNKLYGHTMYI